jgi:perosamine synthetase
MPDYPKPRIPVDPVLDATSFTGPRTLHASSVLDIAHVRHVTSGRMAIGLALREMKVQAGDQILIPAYHSRSMVEPVVAIGAQPVFFRLLEDSRIDLDDIATKITSRTRVLIVVNYFGFPQDLSQIRAFCDIRGLLMLEDCAHAFFGKHAGKPLGSHGDYAIASSMKFFPVCDGGCLVSSRHSLERVHLRSAGLKFEMKMLFNALEKAFAYDRMKVLSTIMAFPIRLKNRLWNNFKNQRPAGVTALAPRASEGAFGFEETWLDKRCSIASRGIIHSVSATRLWTERRENYRRLQAAFALLPGCKPLYESLPDTVCPWVFPLLVAEPETVFSRLKFAGVPIVRFGEFLWDGVDETICATSVDLSRRVLQFPCHQSLTSPELDWMIDTVRTIILTNSSQVNSSQEASA